MNSIINAPGSVKMIINLFGIHAFIVLLTAILGLLFLMTMPFLVFFYIIYLVLSFYLRDIVKKQSSDIPNRIVRVVSCLIIDIVLGSAAVVIYCLMNPIHDLMVIYQVGLIFAAFFFTVMYIFFSFLLISYLRQSPQVKEYYGVNADRWI